MGVLWLCVIYNGVLIAMVLTYFARSVVELSLRKPATTKRFRAGRTAPGWHFQRLRPSIMDPDLPSVLPTDTAAWLATAAASGIVGNLAYDLLKSPVRKLIGRHRQDKDTIDHLERAIAITAVQRFCRDHHLAIPEPAECHVSRLSEDRTHAFVDVRNKRGKLVATVSLPLLTATNQDSTDWLPAQEEIRVIVYRHPLSPKRKL